MHSVQTRSFLLPWAVFAFTGRRLTFQRRLVTLCACEMLLPNFGPLPQISHTCAMTGAPNLSIVYDWDPVPIGLPKTARRLTGVSRAGSQSTDSTGFGVLWANRATRSPELRMTNAEMTNEKQSNSS